MVDGRAERVASVSAIVRPFWVLCLFSFGCVAPSTGVVKFTPEEDGVVITGLSACHPRPDGRPVLLEADRPATILVHGCNSDAGRLSTLAEVFEQHGQQVVCFSYDDRDWLDDASQRLIKVLELLQGHIRPSEITIFGHSQGGLVSRRALIQERERPLEMKPGFSIRLVTASTPFGGIQASRHCGLVWLHVVSLSITVGLCQAIAGNKWTEIPPNSAFIEVPGTLVPEVATHLKVITDERSECREFDDDGTCSEDDFVFSLDEQRNGTIDADNRVSEVTLKAGHSVVIGEGGRAPLRLITILQNRDVLSGK